MTAGGKNDIFISFKAAKHMERRAEMQESGEMYLETILILGAGGTPVRSIDVAEKMCFSRPSVSKAMTRLRRMPASGSTKAV